MHTNRFIAKAVPVILALALALGALPIQNVQAQDSGPSLFLPLISQTQSSEPSSPPAGGGSGGGGGGGGSAPRPPAVNVNDGFFVSPDGSSRGDGSKDRPWDLQTALGQPSAVEPGDTIWLMEGTYGSGGQLVFKSQLQGEPDKPVILRAVPGHRARINGTIHVMKPWSGIWGLEIFNSDTDRQTSEEGSHPGDINRKDGIDVFAPHTFLINNVIHDTRQGVGFWSDGPDSVLYGNIIYNNGWMAPDRGHGHGVYTQNETGMKWIQDNLIFANFSGYNIHVYSTDGFLNGFQIDGNTLFNGQFVLGSQSNPAKNVEISQNTLYNSRVRIGYQKAVTNQDLSFQDNYIHHEPGRAMEIRQWRELQFSGNQVVTGAFSYFPTSSASVNWNNNTYFGTDSQVFSVSSSSKSWDQWRSTTGFDGSSTFTNGTPSGVLAFVRPNQYEAKRANITIYNWDRQDSVSVDISAAGLEPGDSYTLRNVQDYFGDTLTGTYDGGPITIPMRGWDAQKPIGYGDLLAPITFPEFGAFVLTVN